MLIWRKDSNEVPSWLAGMNNVQQSGKCVWIGPAGVIPDVEGAKWISVSDGWEVAQIGDLDPMRYVRDMHAACPVVVVDGSGREWILPSILTPDGIPAVCMRRVLTDQGFKRVYTSDDIAHAVDSCYWWINARKKMDEGGAIDLEEQSSAIISVLVVAYAMDALTIGKLGLIDDILANEGLNIAAGVLDDGKAGA